MLFFHLFTFFLFLNLPQRNLTVIGWTETITATDVLIFLFSILIVDTSLGWQFMSIHFSKWRCRMNYRITTKRELQSRTTKSEHVSSVDSDFDTESLREVRFVISYVSFRYDGIVKVEIIWFLTWKNHWDKRPMRPMSAWKSMWVGSHVGWILLRYVTSKANSNTFNLDLGISDQITASAILKLPG